MANTKSAQKRARQTIKRNSVNQARKSDIKTAVRKVLDAIKAGETSEKTQELFKAAESKIARAKTKGLLHANTVARKIGRLAKRVAQHSKEQ